MTAVACESATKVFRRGARLRPGAGPRRETRALDGLSFRVPGGGRVHGLVGPNGSGKTTALRALVGHVHLDEGRCALLGPPGAAPPLAEALARTGVLIESPRFFPASTARTVVDLERRLLGLPASSVGEVLDLVGLGAHDDQRVGTFSLGMKQRLGIGCALLGDPDLLLVDEPSNGLDPAGMRRLRRLFADLAAAGTTVVVSSHLLGELEAVCDSVTVIASGRCRYDGPLDGLPGDSLEDAFARLTEVPSELVADGWGGA